MKVKDLCGANFNSQLAIRKTCVLYEARLETGNHDLSIARRNGELWNEPSEYNIITVGVGTDLYESGDVLYIRTSGTILLSDLEEEYGVRH